LEQKRITKDLFYQNLAASTEKIAQLKEATKNDNELCALKQIIKTGWPESKDVPALLLVHFDIRCKIYNF
jgi:hypothetical protein